ncbi:hypothetical protein C9J60_25480 [Streptomyces sp. A244]|nr:hypothetical protein C9J60_25480 [Streptomyces sp. A244]
MGGRVASGEQVMSGGAYDQTAPGARVHGARAPYLPPDSRPDVISLTTPGEGLAGGRAVRAAVTVQAGHQCRLPTR